MQGPAFPGWFLAHDMRATRFSDFRRSGFLRSGPLSAASLFLSLTLSPAVLAQGQAQPQVSVRPALHHHAAPAPAAHHAANHPHQDLTPHPVSPPGKAAPAPAPAPAPEASSPGASSATPQSDSRSPAPSKAGQHPTGAAPKKLTRPQKIAALADLLAQAKTPEEAQTLEERLEALRAAGLSPTTQLLLRRAEKDSQTDKPDEAVEDLSDALALQPDSAILWRTRAQTRLAAGDFNAAIADLGEALQRDGRDAKSWGLLSTVEDQRKDGPAALKAWQKVLELNPMADKNHKHLDALHIKAFGQPT